MIPRAVLAVSPPVTECSVSLVSCIGVSFLKSRDREEGGGERKSRGRRRWRGRRRGEGGRREKEEEGGGEEAERETN